MVVCNTKVHIFFYFLNGRSMISQEFASSWPATSHGILLRWVPSSRIVRTQRQKGFLMSFFAKLQIETFSHHYLPGFFVQYPVCLLSGISSYRIQAYSTLLWNRTSPQSQTNTTPVRKIFLMQKKKNNLI